MDFSPGFFIILVMPTFYHTDFLAVKPGRFPLMDIGNIDILFNY